MNPIEALARLKEGNSRFVEGRVWHEHSTPEWRAQLVSGQRPMAVVLGCSDSRVPPELIFGQGFGDLFVIRNAGNVVVPGVLGSIQYAIEHLETRLIVVMGHEECGAVTASLLAPQHRQREPADIQDVLRLIDPALSELDLPADSQQQVAAAVEANTRWGTSQLTYWLAEWATPAADATSVLAAIYSLRTGKVHFLDEFLSENR